MFQERNNVLDIDLTNRLQKRFGEIITEIKEIEKKSKATRAKSGGMRRKQIRTNKSKQNKRRKTKRCRR